MRLGIVYSRKQFQSYNAYYNNLEVKSHFGIKIRGFHPISTAQLFEIERICEQKQLESENGAAIFIDFSKNSLIFDPEEYEIPYSEFKIEIEIYDLKTNKKPLKKIEFLVNLSKINFTKQT